MLALADDEPPRRGSHPLLEVVMRKGKRTTAGQRDLAAAHEHFERQWEALPSECKHVRTPAGYPVTCSDRLVEMAKQIDATPTL